jgi:hypothetical protein
MFLHCNLSNISYVLVNTILFPVQCIACTVRRLHNEELNDLYSSLNIIRVMKSRIMRWEGHAACMGKREMHTGFWWGRPQGRRPLGRPRFRWEDNIKMDLQEVGCGAMDWIELAQDRDK